MAFCLFTFQKTHSNQVLFVDSHMAKLASKFRPSFSQNCLSHQNCIMSHLAVVIYFAMKSHWTCLDFMFICPPKTTAGKRDLASRRIWIPEVVTQLEASFKACIIFWGLVASQVFQTWPHFVQHSISGLNLSWLLPLKEDLAPRGFLVVLQRIFWTFFHILQTLRIQTHAHYVWFYVKGPFPDGRAQGFFPRKVQVTVSWAEKNTFWATATVWASSSGKAAKERVVNNPPILKRGNWYPGSRSINKKPSTT